MKKLSLPDSVTKIGDFCFAYCSNLTEVSLPLGETGESIFTGCESLKKISFPGKSESVCTLYAGTVRYSAPVRLSDPAFLDEGWLARFDAWVTKLLEEPDDEGFQNQILCGEEDYGSCDRDAYESRMRVKKASLCIMRLDCDEELSPACRDLFSDYVFRHRAGSSEGSESWTAVKENFPDKKHFELFESLGCVDDNNRDIMIRDLSEDLPELKSMLLKSGGSGAGERFFSGLEL